MISWLNFGILLISTLLTFFFYWKSAGPAALEQKIGTIAYKRCTIYRFLSGFFMTIVTINYVVYAFYPIPISLPQQFQWPYWVSLLIAILIAIPSGSLWLRGMMDAGEETMIVKKGHKLFGGIYLRIRHPQAAGEMPFWWVIAFILNSPFLVIYSFIWIPIFGAMCYAEEKDLILRYGDDYENYRRTTGAFFPKKA